MAGPSDKENICLNLKLISGSSASGVDWDFGNCFNNQTYSNHQIYDIQCCQPAGNYTLECHSWSIGGWSRGNYLAIEGSSKPYCNGDVTSPSEKIQTVQHKSPDKSMVCINIKVVSVWGRLSWTFGSCVNNTTSLSYSTKTFECCQKGAFYELQCTGQNSHGGYLEIGGSKYCKGSWWGTKSAIVYHSKD